MDVDVWSDDVSLGSDSSQSLSDPHSPYISAGDTSDNLSSKLSVCGTIPVTLTNAEPAPSIITAVVPATLPLQSSQILPVITVTPERSNMQDNISSESNVLLPDEGLKSSVESLPKQANVPSTLTDLVPTVSSKNQLIASLESLESNALVSSDSNTSQTTPVNQSITTHQPRFRKLLEINTGTSLISPRIVDEPDKPPAKFMVIQPRKSFLNPANAAPATTAPVTVAPATTALLNAAPLTITLSPPPALTEIKATRPKSRKNPVTFQTPKKDKKKDSTGSIRLPATPPRPHTSPGPSISSLSAPNSSTLLKSSTTFIPPLIIPTAPPPPLPPPLLPPPLTSAYIDFNACAAYEGFISPADKRDFIYETQVNLQPDRLPINLDIRKTSADYPTGQRAGNSTIVAVVVAAEMNIRHAQLHPGAMSVSWLYHNRRDQQNNNICIRSCLATVQQLGMVPTTMYPRIIDTYVTVQQRIVAANLRILGYARVASPGGLKQALLIHGAAVALLPYYENKGRFWVSEQGEKQIGLHAVVIIGYNERGFIITSWEEGWGRLAEELFPYGDWYCFIERWMMFIRPLNIVLSGADSSAAQAMPRLPPTQPLSSVPISSALPSPPPRTPHKLQYTGCAIQ